MAAAAPITSLLTGLGTAAAGLTVAGEVTRAQKARKAEKERARALERDAQQKQEEAGRAEAERKRRLKASLAAQRALFAGRNVGLGSGTPQTLAGTTRTESAREGAEALNRSNRQATSLLERARASRKSTLGSLGGLLGLAGSRKLF